jgi:hypothetical protein
MSKNRENVIWQGSDGKWNRGFFDFVVTGPDDEWDVEYNHDHFFWTATGLPSEDAAREAWDGANPGGYRRMLWSNKDDRPYIKRYEKMTSEAKPSRAPRRPRRRSHTQLDREIRATLAKSKKPYSW